MIKMIQLKIIHAKKTLKKNIFVDLIEKKVLIKKISLIKKKVQIEKKKKLLILLNANFLIGLMKRMNLILIKINQIKKKK